MENEKTKKGLFDNRLLRTKIKSQNVKIWELFIGYLLGPIGAMLASGVFTSFLNKYYTDALFVEQLSTGSAAEVSGITTFLTLLPLLSTILIVVGNLVAGQLIEHTKTSAGKARPWILLSSVTLTVSSILIFAIPLFFDPSANTTATMIITAVAYNLYYAIAFPLYSTANNTLVAASTRNSNQRSLLASAVNMAATACVGVGGLIFPIILGLMVKEDTLPADARAFYLVAFAIVGILTFVVTILQYFFTRERVTEETKDVPADKTTKLSIGKQFKAVANDKYWWIVLIFCLLFNLGGGMKNVSLTYFSELMDPLIGGDPALAAGVAMSIFTAVGSVVMTAAVALVWPLSVKFDKRRVVIVGLLVGIVGDVICTIGGGNIIVVAVGIALKLLGCAPAAYLLLAMVADSLDHAEARNGFRCDGFTMSIYSSIAVAATPLATALFNAISVSGTSEVGVSFSYIWFEGIMFAICAVLMVFFTVEKFVKADRETIVERQKAEAAAAGIEWVEPEERMRREQEQADIEAEEARIQELKARCEKKGLNFEEEEAKYQAKLAEKKAKADAKKKPEPVAEEPAQEEPKAEEPKEDSTKEDESK